MIVNNDTIVAVATAPAGALSVIRMSGKDAVAICEAVFRPSSGRMLSECQGYTLHHGTVENEHGTIDEVIVSLFRAPKSYTGEDTVEISCHGSPYISREIINALTSKGARCAEAGEFTMRAFLAGKLDLVQAEAVADMISAGNKAAHALASRQIRGGYSADLEALREELTDILSLIELELDFSEEDVEFTDRRKLSELIGVIQGKITRLIESFTLNNVIREGIPVVIAGPPNVGKSTLLNRMLREDRAMVSDIEGTTRDAVEGVVTLGNGVSYRLTDTAGIRRTEDTLEKMGIERSVAALKRAAIILLVLEAGCNSDHIMSEADRIFSLLSYGGTFSAGSDTCNIRSNTDARDVFSAVSYGADTGIADSSREGRGSGGIYGTEVYKLCILLNKTDKAGISRMADEEKERLKHSIAVKYGIFSKPELIEISAKTDYNIDTLTDYLTSIINVEALYDDETVLSNARHYDALQKALDSLDRASRSLEYRLATDLLAQDIREASYHLATITGEITSDDILKSIFSKFCIGK